MANRDCENSSTPAQSSVEGECGGAGMSETPPPTHSNTVEAGAPPSNTAPAKCIAAHSEPQILQTAVDSLYVSYPGQLPSDQAQNLDMLKNIAQLPSSSQRANAHIHFNDHQFEVRDKGKGRFPYVLRDNWFHLQVSGEKSGNLPLVYAQISSQLLTLAGWRSATSDLTATVAQIGGAVGDPSLSRVDLCADFVTARDISAIHQGNWVGRSNKFASYFSRNKFTGYTFGAGGDISCRLYDKTEELAKSKKDYLRDHWRVQGWDGFTPVWRLEFQFKRAVLRELGVVSVADLERSIPGLWKYAAGEWLRLATPIDTDSTRSRWPTDELWTALAEAAWGDLPCRDLSRVPKTRVPEEHYLFFNGISGITSYMAKEGIFDFQSGLYGFVQEAMEYHRSLGRETGTSLHDYAQGKAREKAKRYNTPLSSHLPEPDSPETGEA